MDARMNPDNAAEGFTAMGSTARLEVLRALVRAGRAGRPVSWIQEALAAFILSECCSEEGRNNG